MNSPSRPIGWEYLPGKSDTTAGSIIGGERRAAKMARDEDIGGLGAVGRPHWILTKILDFGTLPVSHGATMSDERRAAPWNLKHTTLSRPLSRSPPLLGHGGAI